MLAHKHIAHTSRCIRRHTTASPQVTAGQVVVDKKETPLIVSIDDVLHSLDSLAHLNIDTILTNPTGYITTLDSVIQKIDTNSISNLSEQDEIIIENTISTLNNEKLLQSLSNLEIVILNNLEQTLLNMISYNRKNVIILVPNNISENRIDNNKIYKYNTYNNINGNLTKFIFLDLTTIYNDFILKLVNIDENDSLVLICSDTNLAGIRNIRKNKNSILFNLETMNNIGEFSIIIKNYFNNDTLLVDTILNKINIIILKNYLRIIPIHCYLLADTSENGKIKNIPKINTNKINQYLNFVFIADNNLNLIFDTIETSYSSFDIDTNSKIQQYSSINPNVISNELRSLFDFYQNDILPNVTPDEYIVFIIPQKIYSFNDNELSKVGGFSITNNNPLDVNNQYPCVLSVFKIPNYDETTSFIEDFAHEIGHQIYGLRHPFEQINNYLQSDDNSNIMDYPSSNINSFKRHLKTYQIREIEPFK